MMVTANIAYGRMCLIAFMFVPFSSCSSGPKLVAFLDLRR